MASSWARDQRALGMRRRRSRQRADARAGGALQEALAYFERNGAEPWAEQARAELRATGEITSRDTTGSWRFLTPQASGPDCGARDNDSRSRRGAVSEPKPSSSISATLITNWDVRSRA